MMDPKLKTKFTGDVVQKVESGHHIRQFGFKQDFCLGLEAIEELRKYHANLETDYAEKHSINPVTFRAKNYFSLRIQKRYLDVVNFKTQFEDGASADWTVQITIAKDKSGVENLSVFLRMTWFNFNESQEHGLDAMYQISILDSSGAQSTYSRCSPIRRFDLQNQPCLGWQNYFRVNKFGLSRMLVWFRVEMCVMKGIEGPPVPTISYQSVIPVPEEQKQIQTTATTSKPIPTDNKPKPTSIDNPIVPKPWYTGNDWDLVIACENISYLVHRRVIVDRSPVLAEFLKLENLKTIQCMGRDRYLLPLTEIVKVGENLIEAVLEFCYTSNTGLFENIEHCASLCEIGFRWKIKPLLQEAFRRLCSPDRLTLDNFELIFRYVQFVLDQPPELLTSVQEFILKNYAEISEFELFQEMMQDETFANIYMSFIF